MKKLEAPTTTICVCVYISVHKTLLKEKFFLKSLHQYFKVQGTLEASRTIRILKKCENRKCFSFSVSASIVSFSAEKLSSCCWNTWRGWFGIFIWTHVKSEFVRDSWSSQKNIRSTRSTHTQERQDLGMNGKKCNFILTAYRPQFLWLSNNSSEFSVLSEHRKLWLPINFIIFAYSLPWL